MRIYNKLVRDKIPEIIRNKGEKCEDRVVPQSDFLCLLQEKLQEELNEYGEADDPVKELVDIAEVVIALAVFEGQYTRAEFLAEVERKYQERGGFEKGIFLISS